MANGFGTIYIGNSGLTSAQNALNTTANNLSNVNTTGYVRQQVRFADRNYLNLKNPQTKVNIQQSGYGVSIGDVVHARDIFVDKAFRLETGREAFYSTCYETTTSVEDLLQELNGQEFADSIEDLYEAIEEMAKDPADSVNQNLLLQKCELFLSRSNSVYSDLKSYQLNLNSQISDKIDRVNEIGDRIYELNLQIQKVEAGGVETAMTMRDERDNLLDELSGLVKMEATEDNFGFVSIEVEGQQFVDDMGCHNIALKYENETGFYTPYWPNMSNASAGQYVNVFDTTKDAQTDNNTDVGTIKALMIQRGDHVATVVDLETDASYKAIESSTLMETQAEIDRLVNKIATTINDIFCPNVGIDGASATAQTDFSNTKSVADADIDSAASTYHLIGAKATDGTAAGRTYISLGTGSDGKEILVAKDSAQILDVDNCNYGSDNSLPPREIFTRNGEDRYEEVTVNGNTYYVYNTPNVENPNTWYHLGTISVNSDLQKNLSLTPSHKANGDVSYDLGQALSAAWSESSMTLNPTDNTPVNFEGYYNKMINKLATDGNIYKAAEETLEATSSSLDNQRQQVTGVSSDEELTNMVKFQQAYNASSRFITVISEMTETIISLI